MRTYSSRHLAKLKNYQKLTCGRYDVHGEGGRLARTPRRDPSRCPGHIGAEEWPVTALAPLGRLGAWGEDTASSSPGAARILFPPRRGGASLDSSCCCSEPESEPELGWLPTGSSGRLSRIDRPLEDLVSRVPLVFFGLTVTTYGSSVSSFSSLGAQGLPALGRRRFDRSSKGTPVL